MTPEEKIATLEARVTDLQASNTQLVTEMRAWKSRAITARSLLTEVLVDYPIAIGSQPTLAPTLAAVQEVVLENDRLSKDAWCGAAILAREFVKEAESSPLDGAVFVRRWKDRFEEITR